MVITLTSLTTIICWIIYRAVGDSIILSCSTYITTNIICSLALGASGCRYSTIVCSTLVNRGYCGASIWLGRANSQIIIGALITWIRTVIIDVTVSYCSIRVLLATVILIQIITSLTGCAIWRVFLYKTASHIIRNTVVIQNLLKWSRKDITNKFL